MQKFKCRDINIELLRVVSMFAILFWHGIHHGFLTIIDLDITSKLLYDIVSWGLLWHVNVFILISGYYGIKFNWKKLIKLLLYVAAYTILIDSVTGFHSLIEIKNSLLGFFRGGAPYWFVRPYLVLFMLSPLLNMANTKTDKEFVSLLIIFSVLNVLFGFFLKNGYNDNGFNSANFNYLYLLGMSIRRFKTLQNIRLVFLIVIFGINVILSYLLADNIFSYGYWYDYNNPLVIINSIVVFLLFSKLTILNVHINTIASSTFSVYLLTDNGERTRIIIVSLINKIYDCSSNIGIDLVLWLLASLFIFVICIIIDKLLKLTVLRWL